jgi:flagellar protein FlaG
MEAANAAAKLEVTSNDSNKKFDGIETQQIANFNLEREYWRKHFDELLEKLNLITRISRIEFRREVHKGTGQIMVSIFDSETGDLLRQIPPERVLDMLTEMMKYLGLKVDLEA